MKYTLEAACGCHCGRIRSNNEDNFYFSGKCLEAQNQGMMPPAAVSVPLGSEVTLAVFDGMGGESYGEVASFRAAQAMQRTERTLADFFIPQRQHLERLTQELNNAVVSAARELNASRMGTTMAALQFSSRAVYVCNLGDSRAFRLRGGELLQISRDHVDSRPLREGRKPGLTQYLGIDPEEMRIEPHIAKGKLQPGDRYLVCSDGLTDMVPEDRITEILTRDSNPESCVNELIQAALDQGGRDNITVIVCTISE